MLQTVRCFDKGFGKLFVKIFWEEEVTYDDRYWEYIEEEYNAYLRYRSDGNFKVPEKPKGMTHCYHTFESYQGDKLDLSSFDTFNVVDMNNMFSGCSNLQYIDLSPFDTSKVTDMEDMFYKCEKLCSLDLSSFDTSKVTQMDGMFYGCTSLQSLDLSSFDTSKVINMRWMFGHCYDLKFLDLSPFDTSKVTDMEDMFYKCEKLCSLDLSSFDTSNVTNMSEMFYKCENLQFLDLSSFDTSNVTNMNSMFYGCKSLDYLDLSSFDTSKVTSMGFMFSRCSSLKSLDLSSFDTRRVGGMYEMFRDCKSLQSLDLSHFDITSVDGYMGTSNMFKGTIFVTEYTGFGTYSKFPKTPKNSNKDVVSTRLSTVRCFNTDASGKLLWEEEVTYDDRYWEYISNKNRAIVVYKSGVGFKVPEKPKGMTHCYKTFSYFDGAGLNLSLFDTSDVVDMHKMFFRCPNLHDVVFSLCDTSKVTDMSSMFFGCERLRHLEISSFDTSKVTDMSKMFYNCENLGSDSMDLSSFDTSNVIDMSEMFYNCWHLKSLDLSSFDTSNVISMSRMFGACWQLESLDLSSFDTSNVIDMSNMFDGCKYLRSLDLSHFIIDEDTNVEYIFAFSGLNWDSTHLDISDSVDSFSRRAIRKRNSDYSLEDISREINKLPSNIILSSPKVVINSLRDNGFSDAKIVGCIFNKVERGFLDRDIYMPIVNSYIEKRIQPEIIKNFNDKSVGEVLDILYSNYPRSIVNRAMCSYLSSQLLVD